MKLGLTIHFIPAFFCMRYRGNVAAGRNEAYYRLKKDFFVKAKEGMIFSALRAFEAAGIGAELDASFTIGDSESDMRAGKAAGTRTAFIGGQYPGADLCGPSLTLIVRRLADLLHRQGGAVRRRGCAESRDIGQNRRRERIG